MIKTPQVLRETARGLSSVSLESEFFRKRELFLPDVVNSESMNELLKQLMHLENEDNTKPVTLYINSPGGEVTSGLAVYDYIRLMKSPVRTVCTGRAASMGSLLFLAGDSREMFEHGEIMIHDPSTAGDITGMKPHEIQAVTDSLNKTREAIAKIIAERTEKTIDEIYELTKNDTFFTAKEALDFKIATKIITTLYEEDSQ